MHLFCLAGLNSGTPSFALGNTALGTLLQRSNEVRLAQRPAGMDGLAGPLHGLANQECLRWLLDVRSTFGHLPEREELKDYLEGELKTGRIVPGYGHAVLRVTDPRFTAQAEFAQKYLPDDEIFRLVMLVYEVLPPILIAQGKVKIEPIISEVLTEQCSGCGICVPLCPYHAISMRTWGERPRAQIEMSACKGCGVCTSACPSGAIVLHGYEESQIFAQIEALTA